jgi:tetratricopeptide (TPR) repeat protein
MVRSARIAAFAAFASCAALLLAGCGGGVKGVDRESAYGSIARAETAFAARDFATAATEFQEALKVGGLNVDAYCDASVKLAVSLGATQKFDEAHALLDKLAAGAPNMDLVYAARSFVLAKQGKAAEANAALANARRLNRAVAPFADK